MATKKNASTAVAAVYLCLRIRVQRFLGGVGVHGVHAAPGKVIVLLFNEACAL